MVECKNCKAIQSNDDVLQIRGIAHVRGKASINNLKRSGVVWVATDSWDEVWLCPECGAENKIEWDN